MDRFLEHWADDLPALWGDKPPNGSYARLSKAKRKAWVEGWLDRLNGAADIRPAVEATGRSPYGRRRIPPPKRTPV